MKVVNNIKVTNLINLNLVRVTWDVEPSADCVQYHIYRSPVSYANFVKVGEVDRNTGEFTDKVPNVLPIAEWYYKVSEFNGTDVGPMVFEGVMFNKTDAFENGRIGGPFQTPLPTDQDMKFYFNEIRSRNLWMLQNDGEPMLLLKRKYTGQICPCIDDADGSDQCGNPLHPEYPCYGTGILGGYYPSLNIMVRRWNQTRAVPIHSVGFEVDTNPTMWTIYTPLITEGDLLIDGENRRWEVTTTHQYHWREMITHQEFQVVLKKPSDIVYKVPILGYRYWGDGYWGMGYYGSVTNF